MDNRLQAGDMMSDFNGDVQTVDGVEELVQCALIRLTMRKGSFPYQPELGSTLYRMDQNKLDDQTIRNAVEESLYGLDEVQLVDIEKSVDVNQGILNLVVYLRVSGKDAIVEWDTIL